MVHFQFFSNWIPPKMTRERPLYKQLWMDGTCGTRIWDHNLIRLGTIRRIVPLESPFQYGAARRILWSGFKDNWFQWWMGRTLEKYIFPDILKNKGCVDHVNNDVTVTYVLHNKGDTWSLYICSIQVQISSVKRPNLGQDSNAKFPMKGLWSC